MHWLSKIRFIGCILQYWVSVINLLIILTDPDGIASIKVGQKLTKLVFRNYNFTVQQFFLKFVWNVGKHKHRLSYQHQQMCVQYRLISKIKYQYVTTKARAYISTNEIKWNGTQKFSTLIKQVTLTHVNIVVLVFTNDSKHFLRAPWRYWSAHC